MTTVIKLDPEDHKLLISLQTRWDELTKLYGELHYQHKTTLSNLELTSKELDDLDNERINAIERLQEKYGSGQVNIKTAEFIPDPPTEV